MKIKNLKSIALVLLCTMLNINYAWGAVVTYTFDGDATPTTTGTAPAGSTAALSGTYTNNGGWMQCANSGSAVLTLTGYTGYKITGITIQVKSNKSSGTGSFSVVAGSTTIASIASSAFNTSNWNGGWDNTSSGVSKTLTMSDDKYGIKTSENVVLSLNVTSSGKSLYIKSWAITYEAVSSGCGKEVTITKGAETNGTYTLSATSICGDAPGGTINISDITPADGFEFDEITTSASGSVDNTNKKVTGITSNTTITVKFKALPTYAIRFFNNGTQVGVTQNIAVGGTPEIPADPDACDEGYTFVGWWTDELDEDNTTAETWITDFTVSGAQDYYAVFSKAGDGGSTVDFDATRPDPATKGGITLTVTSGALDNGTDYRVYKNQTMTITSSIGNMSSISLTYDSPSNDGGGWATSYTPNAASWTSPTASGEQARITNISVTVGVTYYTTDCGSDCSTPTLTFDVAELTKYDGDAPFTEIASLSNNPLGGTITYTSSAPAKAEVDPATGEVTIHDAMSTTPVIITATVAKVTTGAGCQKKVTASYTLNIYNRVTWSVNGAPYTTGGPTTQTTEAGTITSYPTDPDGESACGGKAFVGWTDAPYAENDDAPDPLYTSLSSMASVHITTNTTFYAVFAESDGGGDEIFTKGTSSNLANGKQVVIVHADSRKALSSTSTASNTLTATSVTITSSQITNPAADLKWEIVEADDNYQFMQEDAYLWAGYDETYTLNATDDYDDKWSVTANGDHYYIADVDYYDRKLEYYSTNDEFTTFTGTGANYNMDFYFLTTSYSAYSTTCGPRVQATASPWVTSTKDVAVKIEVPVTATNFDDDCTLSASLSAASISAGFAIVGWGAGGKNVTADTELETSIILSYTPSAYGTTTIPTADATITFSSDYSGSGTPEYVNGTVHGRSLPQKFLIIAKTDNDNKWWAVPADMPTTQGTFAGVEVVPDNTTTPTVVPAGPASALYGLTAVNSGNYADYGQYVRFFSKGTNRMLWASTSGTGIKNDALYTGSSASHNYEWKASTTDGRAYTLTNVSNDDSDRALKYYTVESRFGYYTNGQSTLYIVPVTCDTRATIKSKDSTYNSITLEWEGDPGQTYNLFVQYGGATEKTELLVSSPVTVSGLAHDNSEYTYILSPGAIDDACRLEGTIHTKVAPINVTLSCNGEATDLGAQDNPYVLPTTGSYVADACDDWEFAGWYGSTYAENSTAPTYITQLTSTGTAYAVYQHTDGAGGSENLTITGSQSSGGSYETNYSVTETTSGGDDITIKSNNLLRNTDYIQLKAGAANRIYNTTPMPGDITEIEVTATTNSAYVYVGSSSVGSGSEVLTPTSGAINGTATYTIPAGKTYFAVGATAGSYVVVSSIVVSYSSSSTTYSTTTDCCSEVEKPEVTVVTRTTGATLSWQKQVTATNGYSVTIAEDPTKNADFGTNVTSYVIEGLGETAKYTYTVTAKGPSCTLSTSGEFATDTFKISIAEWDTCGVYLDLGDMMGATAVLENQDTQAEHVANYADSLFFSKYFEADSENKLVAIYNGTKDTINLSNYCLKRSQLNVPAGYTMELSSYGRIKPGHIAPNEEIIFIRYAQREENSAEACASTQKGYENWYVFPNSSSEGNFLNFSGPMSIGLYSKRASKFIDVIGATTNNTGTGSLCQIYASNSVDCDDATKSFNDMAGFYTLEGDKHGTEEVETDYGLSTNRCLLIRKNTVKSGMRAIANNVYATQQECSSDIAEAFTTLSDEWSGLQVGSGTSSGETHSNTCIGMGQVGGFDYNTYYAKYDTITKDLSLDDKRQPDGTYYIHITGLSEKSCTNLRITVKDASDKTINGTWKVPIFVTNDGGALSNGNVATTDAVFTKEGEDCAQCDVVIMRNANLSVATGGKNTVRNVEVYHSGQLNIPSDQSFNIQRLIMRSKEDTVPRADMRGALNQNETTFAFDKRIKAGRWYKIALPYRCKISDVTFRNGELAHYNTDWYLQTYDGDNRANGIQTGNWHIYTGEYMEPGVGYNLAIDEGILDEGNYYAELRFPMTANAEFAENATVPVGVNAWGANNSRTKGGDPVTPNHLGWNMIGNPYMLDYTTGSVTTPLTIGKLETDGITWTLNNNGLRYVVALKSTRDSYEQIAIGAGKKEIEPFMAYFVQIDGSTDREALNITFAKGQQHGRSIVRRSRAQYEEEDNTPVWCAVNITNPLNEKDETTLLISDDFTEDYDMMNDFTKMRGDKYQEYSKPVLASRNTTGDMAFNAVPDSTAAKGVPLTFYTNQAGQFTFRMDFTYGLDKIQRVEIYDNNDKQWHSLMNGDEYSFYSDHLGDNTDRFRMRVVVDREAPQITTDLEPTESENSAPSKLLINGHVYILRGGRIYDITGKQLR